MTSLLAGRARSVTAALGLVLVLLIAGCGGGDSGGGGGGDSTTKGYYGAIDTFCTSVKSAANQVKTDATKLQANIASDPKQAIKSFATTLDTFANATNAALTKFKAAEVPSKYKSFTDQAVAAFGGVVTKLHAAAKGAKSGSVSAVNNLGADLDAIKLPDLPKDVQKNAKSCAAISGK